MDAGTELYTHHAACGCTFDQEDAPVDHCPTAAALAGRRRAAIETGDGQEIRAADAALHEHLAAALRDAKAEAG